MVEFVLLLSGEVKLLDSDAGLELVAGLFVTVEIK